MSTDLNLTRDLEVAGAMAEGLVPYLYEDRLFGEIGSRFPKLTLGGMLMRLYRLQTMETELSAGQQKQLETTVEIFKKHRYEWLNHYRNKLLQEFESRLNAIQWFIDDCKGAPGSCDANYPNEAEKRTIVYHLVQEATEQHVFEKEHRGKLTAIDQKLRGLARGNAFIWDEQLESIYPRSEFWWLYGRPGEKQDV